MIGIIGVFVFLLGAATGSFLNVCIWRMPREESIVHPGSHCTRCNTSLSAADNIPLISFLLLRGKCRYCGAPISPRYFAIELLTAVYFLFTYYWFVIAGSFTSDAMRYIAFADAALFGAAMIAIFFIDLEHFIIPDELNIFGIVLGLVANGIAIATGNAGWTTNILGFQIPLPASIVGILVCGGVFLLITVASYFVFKKDAMGGGDIKLAAAVGANLALGPALLSFFLAVVMGSIIGIALILSRKKSRKDYLPFGPMMVAGALIAMFYGQELIRAWMNYSGLSIV
ncbi:MAG: prepilin peptidase [Armatimonadota bacterium]|jgi:leader peptidase (prepilin peptidase)/N-methyltransferase